MKETWSYDELTRAVEDFITPDASCREIPQVAEFHRVSSAGVVDFWNTLTGDVQTEDDKARIQALLKW